MKKRILWTGFIITAVALVLFSVISAEVYYRAGLDYAKDDLRAYMGAFDETRPKESLTADYAAELSARLCGARVTFLTAEGEFIADSEDGNVASRANRPEVTAALEGGTGEGFDVRASDTVGSNLAYYCRNFPERGYMVRIAVPTSSLAGIYLRSLPTVAVFLLVDLAICLLLTYLCTGFILRPVERLARDAAQNCIVRTDCAELQTLVGFMNRMNETAEERMKEIDEEKNLVVKAQQSKNDFIANITHEMNTPLTSIKGFAELLSSGALEGEQAKRAANTILTQSERLSNLIANIINYNEIDSEDLPLYEVNASKIVEETLEMLAPAFDERKLILLTDIEENVILTSRQERVAEIVGNLIRNAIRYNREGGSVSVQLSREELIVSDTGIGIAEENLNRIFDRFFTVDKSHGGKNGGFGLGLAMVRKLCEKADWELSVKSKLGEGTTFCVRFCKNI